MYNCTKLHTGVAVARVTKDRAARPHLPSTVENQLGRSRQLLTIGQWNVRTLLDREGANRPERRMALVAMELAKYNIDIGIAALCETRFSESGSLDDLEYSFFWSGKPEGERREGGVGFAIKKDIITKLTEMPRPVSDRIMTMRLPLSKDNFATIISVYAPTMTNPDENKEAFYNQLASVLSGIPHTDKLVAFRIRQKHNRQGTSKPTKLNIAKLSTTSYRESFEQEMDSGRRRKTQHQTRNGKLCSRSCTTQPRHILASQTENTRTGSTPTTRSYRLL